MEYWIVTEETLDEVVKKVDQFKEYTGSSLRWYFENEMKRGCEMNCTLVVLYAREEWQHMFISNRYSVPFVIRQLEARLSD
jgi:hypothetical protein